MAEAKEMAALAAAAADDKKAADVQVVDVTGKSDVCDYLVVCTCANNPQTNAVIDEVEERLRKDLDVKPLSVEGRQGQSWVLLDYGPVVVHVMQPEARDFYRIEKLWAEVPEREAS